MTADLAAVVLTKDEERHVAECLDSLSWADETVVFDSFSTDRTVEIAHGLGARVLQHRFVDYAAQRNAALEIVQAKWILFLDADERVTPDLADEIRIAIELEGKDARAGWWIPRHNYMLGHRMRGGGWYPDPQLRLLRREKAQYDTAHPVHEIVVLSGEAGMLENAIIHYNYESVTEFRNKTGRYTELEARILWEQRTRVRPWTYVTMPLREFWRRFLVLKGYRDHVYGLLFCGLMSWYTFVTYWRLRRLNQNRPG